MLSNVKDVELWANTKLAGDWSAPGVVSQIDQPKLQMLGSVFSKGKLDQLVKVRLLIACLLLPKAKKEQLAPELEELARAACNDDDEWVRVMGCSVGGFSGQLDLEAVMKENPMVDETVKSLWALLEEAQPPAGFVPLQELYLHPDIRTVQHHSAAAAHAPEDFRPRDPPDGVAGLPDFSMEALHGGVLPGGQLASPGGRGGNSSVHARRGTGLSGTGLFISSKSLGLPQKIQGARAGSGQLLPGAGDGGPSHPAPEDAAPPLQRRPSHPLPAPAPQRPSKRAALGTGAAEGGERPPLQPPHSEPGAGLPLHSSSSAGVAPTAPPPSADADAAPVPAPHPSDPAPEEPSMMDTDQHDDAGHAAEEEQEAGRLHQAQPVQAGDES